MKIKLLNLNLQLYGGQISSADFEKMKLQYSGLIALLSKNSDKFGYPYTLGFMESYNYNNTGYDEKDAFELWKKLKDLQQYVFDRRGELHA